MDGLGALVRDLAGRHDPHGEDTYLSVYADLDGLHGPALRHRVQEVRAALPPADRAAFEKAWEEAEAEMQAAPAGTPALAVFAAPAHGLRRAVSLAGRVGTVLVLDSSPYIRPLARFVAADRPFALVLLDGERASIHTIVEGVAERAAGVTTDLIGRHRRGGMSQLRFQRRRRGQADRFLDDVADRLRGVMDEEGLERIVVAGPGDAKTRLLARLPPPMRDRVEAVEAADLEDEGIMARMVALGRAAVREDDEAALATLRAEVRRGGLAVTGSFATVRAVRDGRVEALFVEKDRHAGGAKCEAHQSYFEKDGACDACGASGNEVDLIEEAVEHALRTDAATAFLDDPFLHEVGGVAALLRW